MEEKDMIEMAEQELRRKQLKYQQLLKQKKASEKIFIQVKKSYKQRLALVYKTYLIAYNYIEETYQYAQIKLQKIQEELQIVSKQYENQIIHLHKLYQEQAIIQCVHTIKFQPTIVLLAKYKAMDFKDMIQQKQFEIQKEEANLYKTANIMCSLKERNCKQEEEMFVLHQYYNKVKTMHTVTMARSIIRQEIKTIEVLLNDYQAALNEMVKDQVPYEKALQELKQYQILLAKESKKVRCAKKKLQKIKNNKFNPSQN